MNAKTILLLSFTICVLAFSASPSQSQQRADFVRPFFGMYGSQSLAAAIGNATVASGQVIPGMSSNPANIGLNRFGHVQLNFQNNRFTGPDVTSTSTVPGGIYAIFPVPVYQGSLAFSFGIEKEVDFTNGYESIDGRAVEKGGMYATEFGIAYEAVKDFYVGGSYRYLKGSNELSTTGVEENSLLNPEYKGYYFTLGFLNRTSPNILIGGAVDFPAKVEVNDKLTTWNGEIEGNVVTRTWYYTLTKPMVFRVGGSVMYPLWSGFYELEWVDWKSLQFASNNYRKSDVAEINNEIARDFKSGITHHVGAAAHLPWLPLHLYAGYQYLPTPYGGSYVEDRRQSVSGGMSYLLNQQFSLHASITQYFWTFQNLDYSTEKERSQMVLFGASLHY